MPIYEYTCEKCGQVTEVMQKVSDPPPPRCDNCGSKKLAKVVSLTSFHLKGGGWYKDLYGSSGNTATASKKEGTAKTDGAKETKKADAASTAAQCTPPWTMP